MGLRQLLPLFVLFGLIAANGPALAAPGSRTEEAPAEHPVRAIPLPGENGARPALSEPDDSMDEVAARDLPEILRDPDLLPAPARKLHAELLEASRNGDVEALRPLLGTGDEATQLTFGEIGSDPVEFLRGSSGDGEGHEILAILSEVLEAGFVRLDAGTPEELYVWPYFHAYPLDKLDARQRVELFRLVTAGDYQDMVEFGGYHFYRVGISPAGEWVFFVAGD